MGSSGTYTSRNITLSFNYTGKGEVVPFKLHFRSRPISKSDSPSLVDSPSPTTPLLALHMDPRPVRHSWVITPSTTARRRKVMYCNGSINWDATYAIFYAALGELTKIGKPPTRVLYGPTNGTKPIPNSKITPIAVDNVCAKFSAGMMSRTALLQQLDFCTKSLQSCTHSQVNKSTIMPGPRTAPSGAA